MIRTAECFMKYWKPKDQDKIQRETDLIKSGPFRETVYLTKGRGITTLNMGAKNLACINSITLHNIC